MATIPKKKKRAWMALAALGVTLASVYVKPELFNDIRQVVSIVLFSDSASESEATVQPE